MDIKISGAWLDAVTLTTQPQEVLRAMDAVLKAGYQVCVIAIDHVEIEGEAPRFVSVAIEGARE